MTNYWKSRNTLVWALLMLLTLASWLSGTDQGISLDNALYIGVAIMLLAFFKVWLVIRYFMEVRDAPIALKLVCDAWVVVVCAAVLIIYTGVLS